MSRASFSASARIAASSSALKYSLLSMRYSGSRFTASHITMPPCALIMQMHLDISMNCACECLSFQFEVNLFAKFFSFTFVVWTVSTFSKPRDCDNVRLCRGMSGRNRLHSNAIGIEYRSPCGAPVLSRVGQQRCLTHDCRLQAMHRAGDVEHVMKAFSSVDAGHCRIQGILAT